MFTVGNFLAVQWVKLGLSLLWIQAQSLVEELRSHKLSMLKLPQSCLTLCNPRDCSPAGSSVHGILQARILEWDATPSSRGLSQPRDGAHVSYVSCTGRRVLYR